MLDCPTQLPCRSCFQDSSWKLLHPVLWLLCYSYQTESSWGWKFAELCAFGKKKQWKPKLLLKMSATVFSLSLMWNSSLTSLMSRQFFPSAIFTARMQYSKSTPVLELHKKHDGKSALGISTWTQTEPERIWVFGTGGPGCRGERWPQVTKAKLHAHSCWLHSDVYLLRSLV